MSDIKAETPLTELAQGFRKSERSTRTAGRLQVTVFGGDGDVIPGPAMDINSGVRARRRT